ncbi:MAG: thioredoxin family protein [Paracoccaceae bacterium]
MYRRDFLILTAAVSTVPALPALAGFDTGMDYTPGLVTERLAAGETVFLDFSATWCSTCRAQANIIKDLQAENPAYLARVTFVSVDWDTFANDPLTKSLNIPRRSTLVVLKGDKELGRIVAGTSRKEIKALMDTALGAASS